MSNEPTPVEFYGKDTDMGKADAKLKYCIECVSWMFTKEHGCRYVVSTNIHHPVAPQKVYGNHEELNKDNDCPHYKSHSDGLGMAATAGEGTLLKHDPAAQPKAGG